MWITGFSSTTSGFLTYQWVDSSNTSLGGNRGLAYPFTITDHQNDQGIAKAIYTPSSDTQVKLRVSTATGTATVRPTYSYARITQIGTSEWLTGTPFLQDGNSLGERGVLGTNDIYGLAFETNATERLRITETGDVGIGTTSPDASSILEISSTTKGILAPRMTTTQRDAISSPATGLEVYNTTTSKFNYYNGSSWTAVGSGLSTATLSTGSTLSVGTEYHANTATAAFTATLPSAPVDGSHIRIVDVKATFDTNNLTVSRGGSDTIEGSTSVLLSSENGVFDFHYDSGESRWSLAEHDTPAPVTLHQARMRRSTAQSIANGVDTKVTLNAEDFDTGGIADTSTGTVTITQAGRYLLNGGVCFTTALNVQAQIRVGSTTVTRQFLSESSGNGAWCANATAHQDLASGDTVTLYVFQNAGSSQNTLAGNSDEPFLEVIQIPTAVVTNVAQAAEYMYVQLAGAETTNLAQNDHVKFDTVVKSSGSSATLDTSTTYSTTAGAASIGRFTLKSGKTYRLDAGIPYAATAGGTSLIRLRWYDATNGVDISGTALNIEATSTVASQSGAGAIFTATSDTLVELRITSTSSSVTQLGAASTKLYPWAIIETIADGTQVAQFTAATSSAAGTSGFIPKPEAGDQGAVLLGNSDWTDPATELFVDTTNNRVGIGTSSPSVTLDVESSAAADGIDINNTATDGDPTLAFQLSGTNAFTMGVDDGDQDKFKIGTTAIGTNTRLTISGDGNVGIGTTSPSHFVHIKDTPTSSDHSLFVEDSNASTNGQVISKIVTNSANDGAFSFLWLVSDWDGTPDQEFIFRGDGQAYADGAWNANSADFAEWFEKEGEIPEAAVIGLNLETGKVRVWQPGDPLIGVQSTNPGFVGNNIDGAETDWEKMRETHVLVALIGQVDIKSGTVVEEGRKVSTDDGQFIGWRLANGKVGVGLAGPAQAPEVENAALKSTESKFETLQQQIDELSKQNQAPLGQTQAGSAPSLGTLGPVSGEVGFLVAIVLMVAVGAWGWGRRGRTGDTPHKRGRQMEVGLE